MPSDIYYRRAIIQRDDDTPLTYNTDGDSLDNDLILSDETNYLVLAVTANQYIELLSSALNGAFRHYPSRYNDVIYPLIKAGKLLFCQQIIDCILNDIDTQQALLDFLANNGITPNSTTNDSLGDKDLTSGQGCELDNLFGAATGITDLFNDLIIDFIEILNANTNTIGRVGDAIEAIPGVGVLPFDDVLQLVESFFEDVAQNYDAAYTVQLADEIRCDIFCLAQANDCTITPKLLFEYFAERTLVEITTVDFQDFMDFMLQNTFSGTELVYAMHTFVAGVLWFGTSVLKVDINQMQKMVSILWNDPNNDWVLLCDDCAIPWTYNSDWDNTEDWDFAQVGGFGAQVGTYVNNAGYESTNAQTNTTQYWRGTAIEFNFDDLTTIERINLIYDLTKGTYSVANTYGCVFIQGRAGGAGGTLLINDFVTIGDAVNGTDLELLFEGNQLVDYISLTIRSSQSDPAVSYSGYSKLKSVEINGLGTNPFIP